MAKHVRKTSFARTFWAWTAGVTLPLGIGYGVLQAYQPAPVQASAVSETIDLDSIKPCDTEDGTRVDQTYPCKWDPTARGIFIEGDSTTVIVFYRVEEGCPYLPAGAVCQPALEASDLGPQNVIRWDNGTVEWTTTRGD